MRSELTLFFPRYSILICVVNWKILHSRALCLFLWMPPCCPYMPPGVCLREDPYRCQVISWHCLEKYLTCAPANQWRMWILDLHSRLLYALVFIWFASKTISLFVEARYVEWPCLSSPCSFLNSWCIPSVNTEKPT